MQRLVYTVEIDEEFTNFDSFFELLDEIVETELDCNVIRSRLESPDELCENGIWEDEE